MQKLLLKDVLLLRMFEPRLDELSTPLPIDGIEVGAWDRTPVVLDVFLYIDSKYRVSCVVGIGVVGLMGVPFLWW